MIKIFPFSITHHWKSDNKVIEKFVDD